jgi:SAM-dependent methyltransferase
MKLLDRTTNLVVAALKSYGPSGLKKILWDKEFSGTKWNFIDNTVGDCVYPNLEKYANNGSILDLGCGPGNTANELAAAVYERYVGVDISEAALEKARNRTIKNGRENKNTFFQGDFIKFEPTGKFDVILFRESMYHVPMGEIKDTLDHYAPFLKSGGVFVIRIAISDSESEGKDKPRPSAMIRIMESEFDVVEKNIYDGVSRPAVLILSPRHRE